MNLHAKRLQRNSTISWPSQEHFRASGASRGNNQMTAHWRRIRINVPWMRYKGNEILPRKTKYRCERNLRRVGENKIEKMRKMAPNAPIVRVASPTIKNQKFGKGDTAFGCDVVHKEEVDNSRIRHKVLVFGWYCSEKNGEHCQRKGPLFSHQPLRLQPKGWIVMRTVII